MKNILIILFFIYCVTLLSQSNTDYHFPELKMKFSLDKNFKVTKFFNSNWDEKGGNNICPCAGFVGILQVPSGGGMESINVVAYPSNEKGSEANFRNFVWQYEFINSDKQDTLKEKITWLRQKSKLKTKGENRFKDHTVVKLKGKKNNVFYTVYFWGRNFILNERPELFDNFIETFDYSE